MTTKKQTLKTVVFASENARVSMNSTSTVITYTWDINWNNIFPEGFPEIVLATHSFEASQTGVFVFNATAGSTFRVYWQSMLMLCNLPVNSFVTRSPTSAMSGMPFLNVAPAIPCFESASGSARIWTGLRKALPRKFFISNPSQHSTVVIQFVNIKGTAAGGWNGTNAGVQGQDLWTAGKHIFTFVEVS